jgi:S-DNA-T family DNA segregation ATPase FtsK/SpoIIIE
VLLLALSLNRSVDIAPLLRMDEEIALALRVPSVRLARYLGKFVVEIPLPRKYHRRLSLARIRQRVETKALEIPLGISPLSRVVTVKLDDPTTPHMLMVGTTGCGKSTLMQAVLLQAMDQNTPDDLGVALIDLKREDFLSFNGLPHLRHSVVTDIREGLALLRYILQEIEGSKPRPLPRTLVVIDELAYLISETGGVNGQAAELVSKIISIGRGRGYILIAGTQQASQSVIGGPLAAANFAVKIVGAVPGAKQSAVAAGRGGVGAEKLLGKGDFLFVSQGDPIRFQAPYVQVAANGNGASRQLQLELEADDDEDDPGRADPVDPAQVADAIYRRAVDEARGITALVSAWGVGTKKAKRTREFADQLEIEMQDKGMTLCLIDPR